MFVTWIGDHGPRHVHVYKDGRLILKWDLEFGLPMVGTPESRVLELIRELQSEGRL